MEFSKKLKLRLCLAGLYTALGVVSIVIYVFFKENTVLLTFGAAFIAMGILRIASYFRITKDSESIRAKKIAETDERNIAIIERAKSLAFGIYTFGAAITVIVLELAGKNALASVIALSLCPLIFIYWLSYIILQKRS